MESIIEISSNEEYEKYARSVKRDEISILHFSADWVPQCVQMQEALIELSKKLENKHIHISKILAEKVESISEKYNIESVPTIVFLKNDTVIDRLEGANVPLLVKKVNTLAANLIVGNSSPKQSSEITVEQRIKKLIDSASCLLFMKGSKSEAKCGFSKQTLEILNKYDAQYVTFDILSDPELRQALKEYSDWPTYPQLYIDGKFIGGLDIIKELESSGELKSLLPMPQTLDDRLKSLINKASVMVFMKGTPQEPRCGFSKTLIGILNTTGVPYQTFNILLDNEVREGLKAYSEWPTYPQIYVNGNLIGGLDIIKELQEGGELVNTLEGL